jgi:hypothetical protein
MARLADVLQRARDQAKAILGALEQTGHPQTNESSGLYLALVTIHKRAAAQGSARLDEIGAELAQLAALCTGKLAPLKPLLEEAVAIARGRPRPN